MMKQTQNLVTLTNQILDTLSSADFDDLTGNLVEQVQTGPADNEVVITTKEGTFLVTVSPIK